MVQYMNKNSGFIEWSANNSNNTRGGRTRARLVIWLWWTVLFVAAWWLVGTFLTPRTTEVSHDTNADVIDVSAVPVTVITNEKISADVRGLRISNVQLADFARGANDDARVALLGDETDFAEIGFTSNGVAAPDVTTVWNIKDGVMTWRNASGIEFRRSISASGYVITVSDEVFNRSGVAVSLTPYARIARHGWDKASSAGVATGALSYVSGDVERNAWNNLDKKSYAYTTTSGFTGFADQYWETFVSLDSMDQTMRIKKAGDAYVADVAAAPVTIAPGDSAEFKTNMFAGPRDQNVLNDASRFIAGVNRTIDYGWFWFLSRPMLWLLNMLNALVVNYGVAIILMTILLRLIIWPLTRKSYNSMIAMQRMQPEMQRIQKLYANDKMRLQMEMMKLYRTHKTAPMSGCLPMLLQIPIFFALYKALLISVPMRSAEFLWVSDLSVMDPYFILPIFMGLTMWWQSRIQSASQDMATSDAAASTMRIMRWMPVIFTIMFAWMPAGLVLYWTVSNLFGILQMWILKRKK